MQKFATYGSGSRLGFEMAIPEFARDISLSLWALTAGYDLRATHPRTYWLTGKETFLLTNAREFRTC